MLVFGADPTGRRDSADAFDAAIAFAKKHHLKVYLPPGTYQVNRHIIVDDVTIEGAGNWYTIVKGHQVDLAPRRPTDRSTPGSASTARTPSVGGSSNVHLSGFAIEGDVRERIDTDQVNGVGGALSNSTIDGLYIHHTKVGIWFDGPMTNLQITNNVIVDQIADGINFHTGVTNSSVSNNFIRNTGDDGARHVVGEDRGRQQHVRPQHRADAGPRQRHRALRRHRQHGLEQPHRRPDPRGQRHPGRLPLRRGGVHRPRCGSPNNTTVRAGTYELNWNIGLGAIWIYALEKNIDADVEVVGDNFLDNTYNAIMLVSDFPVKDLYSITNVHFKDIRVDGTGTSVLSARVGRLGDVRERGRPQRRRGRRQQLRLVPLHRRPARSSLRSDLGGNDGGGTTGPWLAAWELPNTITCDDRPPVVAPPAPAPWVQP